MTDEQKYERELGGINAKLEYIKAGQDRADKHFTQVFARLDNLDTHGCAQGVQNAKNIDELKHRPFQTVLIWAAIVSAFTALAAWLHRS